MSKAERCSVVEFPIVWGEEEKGCGRKNWLMEDGRSEGGAEELTEFKLQVKLGLSFHDFL